MAVELDKLAGPDGGDEGKRLADFWQKQVTKVKDDTKYKRFIKRGQTIEKRYRDERNRTDGEGARRYNSLWANVQILAPAIYGKPPLPIAERRFRDKDPVGRNAAQILERALRNEMEVSGFDEAMHQAVGDYLLPGRGVLWVRYEPQFEEGLSIVSEGGMDIDDDQGDIEGEDDDQETEKLDDTGDRIVRESTPVDYIYWEDFFVFPFNARTWKEVTAIGKRVYMTRDQMTRRFGKDVGEDIPLKKDDRNAGKYDGADMDPDDKGEVFEIWSMTDRAVYWFAEGYEYLCDRKDDPLKLENFFPVPRPIFANSTNGTLIPIPDFLEYQDQAIQIDELTQRISMLAKACKVAGVYNAAAKDIQRLFDEAVENQLIPVDDWTAFAEKGGVAGNISLLPLKEIIGVINELTTIKEKTIEEMDRLTGITDIMRGTTDAREALGSQRLKTNSAGTRLQRRQNEVARLARDTIRIMADIMCQHFSPISLVEVSGAMYEEGLGNTDMPSLTALQNPQSMGQQPPAPPPMPQLAPPPPPVGGGAQGGPAPSIPPNAGPPTNNVVPFPGGQSPAPPMQPMGMAQPQQPQMPPEMQKQFDALKRISDAIKLLRNERLRGFRVDIEVDSTIQGDNKEEQQSRTQFLTAITGFLQQSFMMAQQMPEIVPLMGKMLQFGVRGYRVGRDLELSIEEFCDQAANVAHERAMNAENKPNPQLITAQASMIKAKATAQAAVGKTQTDAAKVHADMQGDAIKAHGDQLKSAADDRQAAAEIQRQQIENAGEAANNAAEDKTKNIDLIMKQMEANITAMKMHLTNIKVQKADAEPPPGAETG